jgi:hypothetical protein
VTGARFVRRIPVVPVNSACMLLVATLGCSPHGSLGRDLPEGTSGDGTETTTTAPDASSSTHADTSGDSTGPASTDESTTAADACAPAADDTACVACRKLACCDIWTACLADEVCTCIDTCIADGGDPTACETTHCAGPSDAWIHVHDCSAMNCAADC